MGGWVGGGGVKLLAVPCASDSFFCYYNFLDAVYYFRPWPLATLQLTIMGMAMYYDSSC